MGMVANWTPRIFQSLWEMLLTGHRALEWKERSLKPFGGFAGLPTQEQVSFFPLEIYSTLWEEERKVIHCVGG